MVRVCPISVDDAIASELIAELDADLSTRYPGEAIHGIDIADFRAADGYFVIAYRDSDAAGCGAFRPIAERSIEIKRMFVRPQFRGTGVARAILASLEQEARARGFTHAVLETALRQPEAIGLYEACGYSKIEPFGPYVGSQRSVCFRKKL